MLKISYAGCLGLSLAISSQFSVEVFAASENCKKINKKPLFQGSRSFRVIDVVFVMISSMSVLICNRFHTIRANNGKITYF